MDAAAYLKAQGWQGDGHSLDRTGRGIKKPLLVSKKVDVLGLGIKKHTATSDQWWLRAFDTSLRDLGTGKKSALAQIRETGVNRGGLYGFFVKGEGLEGSIGLQENIIASNTPLESITPSSTEVVNPDSSSDSSQSTATTISTISPTPEPFVQVEPSKPAVALIPMSIEKKRKRAGESREDVRKRRKQTRQENAKRDASAARERKIAEGTFDFEAEEERKRIQALNKAANAYVKQQKRAGVFGEVPEHPSIGKSKKAKKEKKSEKTDPPKQVVDVEKTMHADRLAMIENNGPLSNKEIDPPKPPKKLSYKAQKYQREKLLREAKRAEKERLKALMFPEQAAAVSADDEASKLSKEEIKRKRDEEKEQKKAARAERAAIRKAAEEAKERAKQERREAKKARRAEKLKDGDAIAELHAKLKEKRAREAAEKAAQEEAARAQAAQEEADKAAQNQLQKELQNAQNEDKMDLTMQDKPAVGTTGFETGADEIKLGLDTMGRVKKVPGIGRVDKYPSAAEKRERKNIAMALKEGIPYEDYMAKLGAEKAAKKAEEDKEIAELREKRGGMTVKEFRRLKAKERAAEQIKEYDAQMGNTAPATNGVVAVHQTTVEQNGTVNETTTAVIDIDSLPEKKKAKYTAKAEVKGISLEAYLTKRAARGAKNIAQSAPPSNPTDLFMVDTVGNAALTDGTAQPSQADGFIIDTKGDATILAKRTAQLTGPLPPDPRIWADRPVKSLSKAERAARREWMRLRRQARNIAKGKNPLSAKERHKLRMEKKMAVQKRLTAEILREKGVQGASRQQLEQARREAKRKMRDTKREKRGKKIVMERKAKEAKSRISMGGRRG